MSQYKIIDKTPNKDIWKKCAENGNPICDKENRMIHKLKSPSSFTVVTLKSLMHKACVRCGKKISSLEESQKHWMTELEKSKTVVIKKEL